MLCAIVPCASILWGCDVYLLMVVVGLVVTALGSISITVSFTTPLSSALLSPLILHV